MYVCKIIADEATNIEERVEEEEEEGIIKEMKKMRKATKNREAALLVA